jgi:hypothetical protein
MVGHPITALEFRRTAANEIYQGGSADLTVTLSTAPTGPLASSLEFALNVGTDATQVFQGTITIPTSPAATGPNVAWTNDNIIRVAFQTPFVYLGGTLCIDIVGTKMTGQTADWWMADAAYEDITGTVTQIGPGCGPYTNAQGQWSHVSPRSLLAGAHAEFWAYGPPGSFGIFVLGDRAPVPVELTVLGIPSPGCFVYLGAFHNTWLAPFVPPTQPILVPRGGVAEMRIYIPNAPWTLGATLASQWLELSQMQTSNGVEWTIAPSMPTLDMALIDGVPTDPVGKLTVHMAHVLRFEYQ